MDLGAWADAVSPSMQQDVLDRVALAEKLGKSRFASVIFAAAEELVECDEFWDMASALMAGSLAFGAQPEVSMGGPGNFKITLKIEAP